MVQNLRYCPFYLQLYFNMAAMRLLAYLTVIDGPSDRERACLSSISRNISCSTAKTSTLVLLCVASRQTENKEKHLQPSESSCRRDEERRPQGSPTRTRLSFTHTGPEDYRCSCVCLVSVSTGCGWILSGRTWTQPPPNQLLQVCSRGKPGTLLFHLQVMCFGITNPSRCFLLQRFLDVVQTEQSE